MQGGGLLGNKAGCMGKGCALLRDAEEKDDLPGDSVKTATGCMSYQQVPLCRQAC